MDSSFEWDEEKNKINIQKHTINFYEAQKAFLDINRIILEDVEHSITEKRYFCLGKVDGNILTVRFTFRDNHNTDGEIGTVKIVKDFLPHPKELLLKDESVKVTISLSKESIEFFKSEAATAHVPYQKMISIIKKINEHNILVCF